MKGRQWCFCLVEGRIVGVCQISASDRVKTAHRAGIGIAVLKEFWGLGIGTRPFEKITDIGREIRVLYSWSWNLLKETAERVLYMKRRAFGRWVCIPTQ